MATELLGSCSGPGISQVHGQSQRQGPQTAPQTSRQGGPNRAGGPALGLAACAAVQAGSRPLWMEAAVGVCPQAPKPGRPWPVLTWLSAHTSHPRLPGISPEAEAQPSVSLGSPFATSVSLGSLWHRTVSLSCNPHSAQVAHSECAGQPDSCHHKHLWEHTYRRVFCSGSFH